MEIKRTTKINEALAAGSVCDKCGHCCSYGSGALAGNDLQWISNFLNITGKKLKQDYLEEVERFNTKRLRPKMIREKGKTHGRCIFLENSLCSIHPVKPTECRIGTCGPEGEKLSIWFTLNYFVDENDPESVRQWAVYLKTHPSIPGGELEELVPDKDRLRRMLNYSEYEVEK